MSNLLTELNLKTRNANPYDWTCIVELLKEVNLDRWLTGNETFKSFFVGEDKASGNLAYCFSIDYLNDIGILKSFAVKKMLQGKGIGKNIVSELLNICNELGIKRLFAASSESPNFWRKTIFKEIKIHDIQDSYMLSYIDYIKNKIPAEFQYTHFFCLEM